MKQLILILIASAVFFMAMAMIQEWDVFKPFFQGKKVDDEEKRCPEEAPKTLEYFNTILTHIYRYGGDPRFVDRLPASDRIKSEIREDLEYLGRNGIFQVMKLETSSVSSQRPLAESTCEIQAEEHWQLHYEDQTGKRFSEKEMSFVVVLRYVIKKSLSGWTIVSMEPVHEP